MNYVVYRVSQKKSIDKYFMMSHGQGNAKLEYNGVFKAGLCMITGSRSMKFNILLQLKRVVL